MTLARPGPGWVTSARPVFRRRVMADMSSRLFTIAVVLAVIAACSLILLHVFLDITGKVAQQGNGSAAVVRHPIRSQYVRDWAECAT